MRYALDSHQRGIATNECAIERKDIIDSRAAIFEGNAGMNPSQLGRNETDLNTARPSGFRNVTLFRQRRPSNVLDRRVRTDRDCSCGDKFVVTNCIDDATSDKRRGQDTLVALARNNSLLASKFETARKLESERIGLSVKIICNLFSEIIVSSGAVD